MIRFLLIGMSVPEGGVINLWGIDLETYSLVNVQAMREVACTMKIYFEYQIECAVLYGGVVAFSLKKIRGESTWDKEQLKELLDLSASYSRAFVSGMNSYMLTKLDQCKKIKVYQHHAEAIITVVGVRDQDYCVEIIDWHWEAYWRTQSQYAECEAIVNYMNNRDVYLLVNHNKNFVGKAIQCMALLVM